jgi:hypothetical protein
MASGVLTALQQACRKSVRAAMLMRKAWQARGVAHGVAQVLVSNYWHYGSVVGSIKGTPIDWTLIRRAIQNPNLLIATEGKPSTLTPEAKAVSI